jgi:NadR type nicotinamide-nucleotide adenylyltransferase
MEKTNNGIIKIAITGPESTGKTTLTKTLAEYFKTTWAEEYAREYLNNLGRDYVFNDLEEIAKGQIRNMENAATQANKVYFSDTELLVIKIWSIYKYGVCSKFILENLKKQDIDLYLLTYPDLEWEYDPLRELPSDEMRMELFYIYKEELEEYGFNFEIIKGQGKERFDNALKAIKKHFGHKLL